MAVDDQERRAIDRKGSSTPNRILNRCFGCIVRRSLRGSLPALISSGHSIGRCPFINVRIAGLKRRKGDRGTLDPEFYSFMRAVDPLLYFFLFNLRVIYSLGVRAVGLAFFRIRRRPAHR